MKCRLLTAATMAVMMLLGPLAATAFAQPEGFNPGQCRAALLELDDITDADLAGLTNEEILALCAIYLPDLEVLPEVIERQPEPEVEVAAVVAAQPTEVLGVSLARTGANTLVLALFGALLVGLGFLAVRRPKRVDDGA